MPGSYDLKAANRFPRLAKSRQFKQRDIGEDEIQVKLQEEIADAFRFHGMMAILLSPCCRCRDIMESMLREEKLCFGRPIPLLMNYILRRQRQRTRQFGLIVFETE
jgi:hypothetical protein